MGRGFEIQKRHGSAALQKGCRLRRWEVARMLVGVIFPGDDDEGIMELTCIIRDNLLRKIVSATDYLIDRVVFLYSYTNYYA